MTPVVIASLLGFSLIVIEFSRSLPELLRIMKTHSLDGLSYVGQGVLFGTIPVWLAVAVVEGGPWILAVEITFVIFHSLLVTVSYRVDKVFGKKVLKVAAVSAIITYPIVLVFGLLVSFGIILTVFLIAATAAYSFPALYSGLTSVTTKGLSVISLSVNTFEGIVYTIGGLGLIALTNGAGITVSYTLYGLITILLNVPRLTRTSYRRLNNLD